MRATYCNWSRESDGKWQNTTKTPQSCLCSSPARPAPGLPRGKQVCGLPTTQEPQLGQRPKSSSPSPGRDTGADSEALHPLPAHPHTPWGLTYLLNQSFRQGCPRGLTHLSSVGPSSLLSRLWARKTRTTQVRTNSARALWKFRMQAASRKAVYAGSRWRMKQRRDCG